MEQRPISLQLMDPNCKQIHARAYTVPRLVDIGVLEEDYSSEWASITPSFEIPKKNGASTTTINDTDFRKLNLLLKHRMSPISYSKDLEC
jgi:hypothetical protein